MANKFWKIKLSLCIVLLASTLTLNTTECLMGQIKQFGNLIWKTQTNLPLKNLEPLKCDNVDPCYRNITTEQKILVDCFKAVTEQFTCVQLHFSIS